MSNTEEAQQSSHGYTQPIGYKDGHIPKARERGKYYDRCKEEGWFDKLLAREVTQAHVAEQIGCAQAQVSRALAAYREDLRIEHELHQFQEDIEGVTINIDAVKTEEDVRDLVDVFAEWRGKFFVTPRTRIPYDTPAHQRRWAFYIFSAIRWGMKVLILSPPRHGKTELLIHICVFVITRINPDVRIIFLSKTEGMASKATTAALATLEQNEDLVTYTLGPNGSFQPSGRSRLPWTRTEFTVATRSVQTKSPTMAAVGSGGTMLSRDGDIIVADDLEDHKTVRTPDGREATREWWANDVMSRVEEHTALICIGSRQHPDDLWGYLIENPVFDVVEVCRVHDEVECEVEDPDNPENWDKHDGKCLLWPEVRTYRWFMDKKNDPQIAPTFAMTYQNEPQDSQADVFTRELVDSIRSPIYTTGVWPLTTSTHPGTGQPTGDDQDRVIRLIAGLDPSGVNYQASLLIAYDLSTDTQFWCDFDNHLGGGAGPALNIIQDWYYQYGLNYWVIEENLYRKGLSQEHNLVEFTSQHGITIIGHETYANKWDPSVGVSTMATGMRDGHIYIPWQTHEDQAKWYEMRRQLINFSRDFQGSRSRKGTHTDLVMAAWFPQETIRQWRRQYLADVMRRQVDEDDDYLFEPMADIYERSFGADYHYPNLYKRDASQLTGVR